jgi:hypothetical protein
MPEPYHWLTLEEVVKHAPVSAREVTYWIDASGKRPKSERLKSFKKGRRRFVRSDDLDAFLLGKPPPSDRDEVVLGSPLTAADYVVIDPAPGPGEYVPRGVRAENIWIEDEHEDREPDMDDIGD